MLQRTRSCSTLGRWCQGPIFGATMISGQKAAHLALKALGLPNEVDGYYKPNVHPELILASTDEKTASAQDLL